MITENNKYRVMMDTIEALDMFDTNNFHVRDMVSDVPSVQDVTKRGAQETIENYFKLDVYHVYLDVVTGVIELVFKSSIDTVEIIPFID